MTYSEHFKNGRREIHRLVRPTDGPAFRVVISRDPVRHVFTITVPALDDNPQEVHSAEFVANAHENILEDAVRRVVRQAKKKLKEKQMAVWNGFPPQQTRPQKLSMSMDGGQTWTTNWTNTTTVLSGGRIKSNKKKEEKLSGLDAHLAWLDGELERVRCSL